MTENKIGNFEAVALILTVMINHIILNLPKSLIQSNSSGAITNVIFISLVALVIVYLICQLLKTFLGLDIFDIAKYLGGKWLKVFIGILFLCYLLFTVSTLLRSFSETLKIIFFPRTPVPIIMLLFLLTIVIVNKLGFRPLARSNLFFMPVILFSILFIFVANFGNFTFQRALPLLGNGAISTFLSGISNLFAFGGISYLYFIPPYLKEQKDYTKVAFSAVGISAVFLLMSVSTLLLMFPLVASSEEVLPLYLASRFIEFGRFFQRLDAIFVFIWIISMASYLSIAFYFATNIFQKVLNLQSTKWIIGLLASIAFGFGLCPQNLQQISFLENTVYKYIILILVIGIGLGTLTLANIKHLIKRKKKNSSILEEANIKQL